MRRKARLKKNSKNSLHNTFHVDKRHKPENKSSEGNLNSIKPNKSMLRHIISKLLETKEKEKNLESSTKK